VPCDIGEPRLSGADGAREIVFDELKFLTDDAEGIVSSLEQGYFAINFGRNGGFLCHR
jgi:hypothetical protein